MTESHSIVLRPYQVACIERILEAYNGQPVGGRALLVLPTGCGKTVIFAEVARRLQVPALLLAHRKELLQQAAQKFRLLDPDVQVSQVGAGCDDWSGLVTVASIQTVSRQEHFERLEGMHYGLVIVDECHHSASESYLRVLDLLRPQSFVLGVTATPDRLDGEDITKIFGQPVASYEISEMVSQGHLCDLRAIAVRTEVSLDELHTRAGDFQQEELEGLIDQSARNMRVAQAYLEYARGRQALCFAVTTLHAANLVEAFLEAGVPAGMVSGETPVEERRRILLAYEQGAINVLCNVGVLTEGYDMPATSCIILARPTQSRGLYTQMVGRGTRLAPAKQDCLVLDITDNCKNHKLQPVTLATALDLELLDGESVLEQQQREREKTAQRRPVDAGHASKQGPRAHPHRYSDVEVNLLGGLKWMTLSNGEYSLVLPIYGLAIHLQPSRTQPGEYRVMARLGANKSWQCWLEHIPLAWAQQFAEDKANLILQDKKNIVLLDKYATWRRKPASNKQLSRLRALGIIHAAEITSGMASDLIAQHNARHQQRQQSGD